MMLEDSANPAHFLSGEAVFGGGPTATRSQDVAARSERPARVLYIEDNQANLELVERLLARLPTVEVAAATDGATGLSAALSAPPDLILLDLQLPDMTGDHVLAALRNDPRTRHVPVLVLTADATLGRGEELERQGADGYLTKPLDLRVLLERLREHLGAAADSAGLRRSRSGTATPTEPRSEC